MLLRPPWRRLRNGLRQSGAEHDAPRSRLYWRQWQSSTARGGLVIQFTVAPHASWGTYDQDGQQINSDNVTNQWHYRRVDLTPFAGKTINWMWVTADSQTLPGYYDMTFQDIALVSADGTVRRVFSRDKMIALTPFASSGVTGQAYSISHAAGVGWYPPVTTTYYHGDHLGSSRQMTNADGYPVWEATYLPYGQERAVAGGSSASVNHYKFTGKERDPESGLDYFGARYYASALGRFASTDGAGFDSAVPQSLNMYRYALNNPMRYVDPTGLYEEDVHRDATYILALAVGFSSEQANRIANANQLVDDAFFTSPFTGAMLGSLRGDTGHHFVSVDRLNELRLEALSLVHKGRKVVGWAQAAGAYLHALQDLFSHQDLKFQTSTAPDKTHNNPTKALAAFHASLDFLAQLNGVEKYKGRLFLALKNPLLELASEPDPKKKVRIRQGIERRAKEEWEKIEKELREQFDGPGLNNERQRGMAEHVARLPLP